MNCYCENCEGSGRVTCDECDGRGEWESSLSRAKIGRETAGYEDLIELQKDLDRVGKQATRLKLLRPNRAASYDAQLRAVTEEIERQADEVAKRAAKAGRGFPFRWT
jgi:hypothetical protein